MNIGDLENRLGINGFKYPDIERLELYKNMNTVKIDTTNISINETVDKIIKITCK